MTEAKRKFWRNILEKALASLVVLLVVGGLSLVSFTYEESYKTERNAEKIKYLNTHVESVGTVPVVNALKVGNMEKQVEEMKVDFKEFRKQYNADRDKIFILLYEIKNK